MSEFIRCDGCGDLSNFEEITYINNTPLCSSCQDERVYSLHTEADEYAK